MAGGPLCDETGYQEHESHHEHRGLRAINNANAVGNARTRRQRQEIPPLRMTLRSADRISNSTTDNNSVHRNESPPNINSEPAAAAIASTSGLNSVQSVEATSSNVQCNAKKRKKTYWAMICDKVIKREFIESDDDEMEKRSSRKRKKMFTSETAQRVIVKCEMTDSEDDETPQKVAQLRKRIRRSGLARIDYQDQGVRRLPKEHTCLVANCNETFTTKSEEETHLKVVHARLQIWQCRDCARNYPTFGGLLEHWRYLHEKVDYPCPLDGCSKVLETRKEYLEHFHVEHKILPKISSNVFDGPGDKETLKMFLSCVNLFLVERRAARLRKKASSAAPKDDNPTTTKSTVDEDVVNVAPVMMDTSAFAIEADPNEDEHYAYSLNKIANFKCPICPMNRQFVNYIAWEKHRARHHSAELLCPQKGCTFYCSNDSIREEYKFPPAMERHLSRKHPHLRFYSCKRCCNYWSTSQCRVKQHVSLTHLGLDCEAAYLKEFVDLNCKSFFDDSIITGAYIPPRPLHPKLMPGSSLSVPENICTLCEPAVMFPSQNGSLQDWKDHLLEHFPKELWCPMYDCTFRTFFGTEQMFRHLREHDDMIYNMCKCGYLAMVPETMRRHIATVHCNPRLGTSEVIKKLDSFSEVSLEAL